MSAPTVEQFGSALLTTRIERAGDGYRWTRLLGRSAPASFSSVPVGSRSGCVPGSLRGLAFSDTDPQDVGARSYVVAGHSSIADRLLAGQLAEPAAAIALTESLGHVGSFLRALHDTTLPSSTAEPHRGWRRLHQWTTGRATTSVALHAVDNVRGELGTDRWSTLTRWIDDTTVERHQGPVVTLHGAPGLGSIVVDEFGCSPDVLTGEDVTVGPWYWDVGWILGELAELSTSTPGSRDAWRALTDALWRGYDPRGDRSREDRRATDRIATMRIALHLHDFIAYVGWSGSECRRYCALLCALIDGQAPA